MTAILEVAFINNPDRIDKLEIKRLPTVKFLYTGNQVIHVNDLITSRQFMNPCLVMNVKYPSSIPSNLKPINVESIKKFEKMEKKSSVSDLIKGLTNRMVPEVDHNLRISQNGICVPTSDGMVIGFDPQTGERVEELAITAFKVPVYIVTKPIDQVVKGDVIKVSSNSYGLVTKSYEADDDSIKTVLFSTGTNHSFKPAKNAMLGQKTVRCALNMFGNMTGAGINPLFLNIAQGDDAENMDFEEIMKMSMLSRAMGANNSMSGMFNNDLLLMSLLGKGEKSEMSEMMQMMVFSQLMNPGQNQGQNPFMNMFPGTQNPGVQQTPVSAPQSSSSKKPEDMTVEELEAYVEEKKKKAELLKQLKSLEEQNPENN